MGGHQFLIIVPLISVTSTEEDTEHLVSELLYSYGNLLSCTGRIFSRLRLFNFRTYAFPTIGRAERTN